MLEKETREYIDKKLKQFWWYINNYNQVQLEYPINWDSSFFADYALLDNDNTVLAIVEAKKFERSARDGQFQALEYAEILEAKQWYRPFIFLSNWKELFFYNSAKELPPKKIKTFFHIKDLRRLKELQKMELPPTSIKIDSNISWRYYQQEAIKKVVEWVEQWKREFLLVMATGTGKTRTAMGLIDVLLKSYNIQKVLFLTDRTALRDQAYDDWFAVYFKSTPKTKIETWKTDDDARLFSATYQTMINYLPEFSSGFFDLVIVDEVHRSAYNEYKKVLDHFDAIKVWLTATPVQFLQRDTYKLFWLKDEWATYCYDIDNAISDKNLVPYNVLIARTRFQIQWIKWRQLPKELLDQLIKEWKDPEEYNFEWSEIWKKIDNKDTNRAVIKEFMEQSIKIEDWLPWKTIIFAMNQKHAENLQNTFEEMYPNLNNFSVIITSNVERHDELLKDFKKLKTEKKFRVAISVDMLDTWIDVPEIVNLVFARKVFSESKFWQMIWRWTRLCPNVFWPWLDKECFQIIDFALNFDEEHTFKNPAPYVASIQQKYYESKIELLKLFEHRWDKKNFEVVKKELIQMVKSLKENDELYERKTIIENIVTWRIFDNIAINPYEELQKIAPLLRYYDSDSIDEIKFLLKNERLRIAILKKEETKNLINSIASDINALSKTINAVNKKEERIKEVLTPSFWQEIDIDTINQLKLDFTNLMKYRNPEKPNIIITDIEDDIIERRWIEYSEGKKMESDKYWQKFVEQIEAFANKSKALEKIKNWETINANDLWELERLFMQSEYNITIQNLRRVYWRSTLEFEQLIKVALWKATLPEWNDEVSEIFEKYLQENNFSSNQIRFLQIVKAVIIKQKFITYEDFYSDTFEKSFGIWAFERLFRQPEQKKVMELVDKFVLI